MNNSKFACFATTNRGLESLLLQELEQLGAIDIIEVNAGARFYADLHTVMKINLHSRIASRIMIEIAYGEYSHEEDIYNLAFNIDWSKWFDVNNSIKISTTAIKSPLRSLEYITLKVKDAICDKFVAINGNRPDVNKIQPDIRIYNFLNNNTATIYLDTSGEALFKRGYRKNKLEAPLKENLAAGLIYLSNWDRNSPFYDPMCGSGTIVIEAVSIGLNIAPGLNRSFAFNKLKQFDLKYFEELKTEAKKAINYNKNLNIFASDISSKAIAMTKENLVNANLLKYVKIKQEDFLSTQKPYTTGTMLFNPPYGIRLDEKEKLATFYPLLSQHLKNSYAGWNCYILSAELAINKMMRLKESRKTPVFNGDLDCRLFEFKMVSGSNRKDK